MVERPLPTPHRRSLLLRPHDKLLSCFFVARKSCVSRSKRCSPNSVRSTRRSGLSYDLIQQFARMLRNRTGDLLDTWLAQVASSNLPELQSFAAGIEKDKDAVRAGLTWWINNGVVEGHVTKLKLIKRQGYGRAGFPRLAKTGPSCGVRGMRTFTTASRARAVDFGQEPRGKPGANRRAPWLLHRKQSYSKLYVRWDRVDNFLPIALRYA